MSEVHQAQDPGAISEIGTLLDHIGATQNRSDGHTQPDPNEDERRDPQGDIGAGSTGSDLDLEEQEPTENLEADPEAAPGDDGEADADEPITVASLAEKLGVEAKDLYDELQIPMADGESISLGEFKDRAKDLLELDTQRNDHKAVQADYEKGQLRDRALLNEMMQMMGDNARPLLEAAKTRLSTWSDEQRGLILKAIPDWNDPDNLARDRKAIVSLGAEFGFSEVEMTHTQDARTVRMLRDYARLRAQQDGADPKAKQKRATPDGKGKQNRNSKKGALAKVLAKAKSSTRDQDKNTGVAAILRSEGLA